MVEFCGGPTHNLLADGLRAEQPTPPWEFLPSTDWNSGKAKIYYARDEAFIQTVIYYTVPITVPMYQFGTQFFFPGRAEIIASGGSADIRIECWQLIMPLHSAFTSMKDI